MELLGFNWSIVLSEDVSILREKKMQTTDALKYTKSVVS